MAKKLIGSAGRTTPAYEAARQAATTLASILLDGMPPATRMGLALTPRIVQTNQVQGFARRRQSEARVQSSKANRGGKAILRIRRSQAQPNPPGLTQKEVAMLLNLSERGVREIERRAFRKLRAHPALREVWRQFLAGELVESTAPLTRQEIAALFRLTRTSEERQVLRKVLQLVAD